MMKRLLPKLIALALLSPGYVCGQSGQINAIQTYCGPQDAKFSVRLGNGPPPVSSPQNGTGTVVIVPEGIGISFGCRSMTVRVGLDGTWIGATCLGGALVSEVGAGSHHLCVDLLQRRKPEDSAFHSLMVEPGKTYYFRAEAVDQIALHLEAIDEDEGKYLLSTTRVSESKGATASQQP